MTSLRVLLSALFLLTSLGCEPPPSRRELPSPSTAEFESEVYPLLLRDCGFAECHGTRDRFFQVFGPGRERLSPDSSPFDPATSEELDLTYGRARSMLATRGSVREAPLLKKPLDEAAGGAGHLGEDPWKQNVYRSREDDGYQLLLHWARSMREAE